MPECFKRLCRKSVQARRQICRCGTGRGTTHRPRCGAGKTCRIISLNLKVRKAFPWRAMIISDDDRQLVESELIYKLAPENVIENTDWIKPGKVAWDWWNALNIYGVDFKSGVNNATYKYYIDFAQNTASITLSSTKAGITSTTSCM
jgi:hypothetical protein